MNVPKCRTAEAQKNMIDTSSTYFTSTEITKTQITLFIYFVYEGATQVTG